jgi:hypothetical protein
MKAVVDNDILLKGACYNLIDEVILWISSSAQETVGVLGTARFVLPNKIRKATLNTDKDVVIKRLLAIIDQVTTLEPTEVELLLAADLELLGQQIGVNLDSGESQLCALMILREIEILLTGDKRAIMAIESLSKSRDDLVALEGKVMCFEQVILGLFYRDRNHIRSSICSEPKVDKTLSICFSCTCEGILSQSCKEGLESYISSLRSSASRVLVPN